MGWRIHIEGRKTAPLSRSQRIERRLHIALVVCLVLAALVALAGLMPPQPLRRTAATWGAGAGALTLVVLVLAGWRLGAWFWYPIQLALMLLVGASGGAAAVGIYVALFDPPPPPVDPAVRLREALR